jgi:hypothetical protein
MAKLSTTYSRGQLAKSTGVKGETGLSGLCRVFLTFLQLNYQLQELKMNSNLLIFALIIGFHLEPVWALLLIMIAVIVYVRLPWNRKNWINLVCST